MKRFLKSAFITSFGTLLSRLSGYARDIAIANYLGSGFYSDVFFMAFRIPNFFRKIFAEGAFNSAFTPIFASGIELHGKSKMMIFARNIYSILLYSLLILTLLAELGMPFVMYIMAPGYVDDPEKFEMITALTKITFPYLIFISLVSPMSGILNTFNKFFATSITPVVLNGVLVAFTVVFAGSSERAMAFVLSYGVFFAGIAQLIWILFFTFRERVFLYPTFPRLTSTTKKFFQKFFNSFLSSGIMQVNSIIDSIIATLIPGSAVSILYYSDRISQFPLSLIGTAIGISILPVLSKTLGKNGNLEDAQSIQEDSIFLACFLGIPSSVGLFLLANLVVQVLFQRGEFTAQNTLQVASVLKIYAIAIPFFILSKILQTIFYAKKDTYTPMKNSLYCLIINSVASLALVFVIGARGIAIATTLSSIFATISLLIKLIKTKTFVFSDILQLKLLKILYTSIIMGVAIVSLKAFLGRFSMPAFIELAVNISISGAIYFLLSFILGIFNLRDFIGNFKK